MKKKVLFILLFMFLFLPLNIKAASIGNTYVTSLNEVTVGQEYSFGVNVGVDGIQKGSADSLGIWLVVFELEFDEDVIIITDVSSNQWNSILYKEDNKYYVLSEVNDNNAAKNKCIDEVLYCSDYYVSIHFYVKNTDNISTAIRVGDVEIGLLEMIQEGNTYTEEDMTVISGSIEQTLTPKIRQPSTTVVTKEPTTIVEEEKPKTSNKEITNKKDTTNETKIKSNNKYLKSLKIENYSINFNKYLLEYDITVEEGVNSLKLTATPDDTKATYKITGADDLKKNNYQVQVVVTAENGNKSTYIINVKVKEKEEVIIEEEEIKEEKKEFKLTEEHLMIGGIIGGVILILLIIYFIISHHNNRKIDKALDEL